MTHPRILRAGQRFNLAHPLMHGSPSLAGPSLYLLHGPAAVGSVQSGLQTVQYQGGVSANTPLGTAGKSGSTSTALYPVAAADIGLSGLNTYTFLAYGSCSNSGIYSAFDQDNGSTRRFQFRINAGKLELIVFDGGNNVLTTVGSPTAMSAADCAAGFLMMGTVQPGRAAIVQGRSITEASIGTPGAITNAQINIGARVTGTQAWSTGGLTFVVAWPRAFTTAELALVASDPTALFEWDDDYDTLAAPAAAGTTNTTASLAWSEDPDTNSTTVQATDSAAIAWTEADDIHTLVARATDRITIAWIEANDSTQLQGSVTPNQTGGNVAAILGWTEADDGSSLALKLLDRLSIIWAEQSDTMSITGNAGQMAPLTGTVTYRYLERSKLTEVKYGQ